MNATVAPATGAFVTAMLGYKPQQRVTFDYAGHALVVTRDGVPDGTTLTGVEYGVTELDAEGVGTGDWVYVLSAECRYHNGAKRFAVQTMFGEVLAEAATLEAALGAMLAHFER
jgi:hypothetical protein